MKSSADNGSVGGGPLYIAECRYPSLADHTMQPARAFLPAPGSPVPLVVGLHTWSGDYRQKYLPRIERWCVDRRWAYIYPNFRGPSWTPQATGSDLVVQDIVSAVEFARDRSDIDDSRIYLVGASGGGYTALLLAGRAPEIWTAVSAWVPISDLSAWHRECSARGLHYADHIVKSVGGAPGESEDVDRELAYRSPVTWLVNARGVCFDLNAGIHDGHTGAVPVSHAIRAFNCLAYPADRFAEQDIAFITENEHIPESLDEPGLHDDSYGAKKVLLRRQSGAARLTLFEGGHDIVEEAALKWLAARRRPLD